VEVDNSTQSYSGATSGPSNSKAIVRSLQWRVPKGLTPCYLKALLVIHTPTTNPDKARELREKMVEASRKGAKDLYNFFSNSLGILGTPKRRNREMNHVRLHITAQAHAALGGAFRAIEEACGFECIECDKYAGESLKSAKKMLDLAVSLGSAALLKNRIEAIWTLAEGIDEIKDTPAFREFVKKYLSNKQTIVSVRLPRVGKYNVNAPEEFGSLLEALEELITRCGVKKRGLKSKIAEATFRSLFEKPKDLESTDIEYYQFELGEPLNTTTAYAYSLGKKLVRELIWTRY